MKVTVIMGIYNCENTLIESLESLFTQTYTDWDLVMCDDGSNDSTYKIAEQYAAGFLGQNITEPLYAMRDDRNAYFRRKFKHRINEFRVHIKAARLLHLSLKAYIYAFRPIAVGLMPEKLYRALHKMRLEKTL